VRSSGQSKIGATPIFRWNKGQPALHSKLLYRKRTIRGLYAFAERQSGSNFVVSVSEASAKELVLVKVLKAFFDLHRYLGFEAEAKQETARCCINRRKFKGTGSTEGSVV